ncbi:hypothetical protein [Actinocrispum sp. NPDC049592]|uniref:hypothetical protein n=1 Tax=Actinocrispum sp. NPDC049592 TaxID=3154835 RepID=UPI0034310FC7
MSRHAVRPGFPAFEVSAELRGRPAQHRKGVEKMRGRRPEKQPAEEQPAAAA